MIHVPFGAWVEQAAQTCRGVVVPLMFNVAGLAGGGSVTDTGGPPLSGSTTKVIFVQLDGAVKGTSMVPGVLPVVTGDSTGAAGALGSKVPVEVGVKVPLYWAVFTPFVPYTLYGVLATHGKAQTRTPLSDKIHV